MKTILIFSMLLMILINSAFVSAVSVLNKEDTITLEMNKACTFPLIIQNSDGENRNVVVTSGGYAGTWILFGTDRKDSYDLSLSPYSQTILFVTIAAPSNYAVGSYNAEILIDGENVYDFDLNLVPSISEIKTLMGSIGLNRTLNNLRNQIETKINEIKDEINKFKDDINTLKDESVHIKENTDKSVSELEKYQNKVSSLDSKVSSLESKTEELSKITGNITASYASTLFIVGIFVGFAFVYLFSKKEGIKNKLKRKKKDLSKINIEENTDYHYKS